MEGMSKNTKQWQKKRLITIKAAQINNSILTMTCNVKGLACTHRAPTLQLTLQSTLASFGCFGFMAYNYYTKYFYSVPSLPNSCGY